MADKKEFRELTDEETEQVAGGGTELIADEVEASSDLTDLTKTILEVKAEVGETQDKLTIKPKDPTDKAFMKVVIPPDPGAE